MTIDEDLARSLGWPKLKYAAVERERRWLCRELPAGLAGPPERITDRYITGTRLRLREALPLDGSPPLRRLTRKADVDASRRLITLIYLQPNEFELLRELPAEVVRKLRHRIQAAPGSAFMAVDRFEGALEGLILAEAEFDDDAAMAAFPAPAFASREVTEDERYYGGWLALHGLPAESN
jgi:CYTH domain-containing protein